MAVVISGKPDCGMLKLRAPNCMFPPARASRRKATVCVQALVLASVAVLLLAGRVSAAFSPQLPPRDTAPSIAAHGTFAPSAVAPSSFAAAGADVGQADRPADGGSLRKNWVKVSLILILNTIVIAGCVYLVVEWRYAPGMRRKLERAIALHEHDLQQHKETAEALGEVVRAREELAQIVDYSPAVCFLWRSKEPWPVEFVSENVNQFGYAKQDFNEGGRCFTDIVHPDDLSRVRKELAGHDAGREDTFLQEYRVVTSDSRERWIENRIWARRNSAGEVTQYQGILLDVTDRKEAEEKLRRAKRDLEDANQRLEQAIDRVQDLAVQVGAANAAKSNLLVSINREVRTRVHEIVGTSHLLVDSQVTPEQTEYVGGIHCSAQDLLSLLDDIVRSPGIAAGGPTLQAMDFDLAQLLDQIGREFAVQAHAKKLVFRTEIVPDVPSKLTGDPGRLCQVLSHLIENAVAYTDQGSVINTVTLEARAGGKASLRFSVTDTGVGIPEDRLDSIFEPIIATDSAPAGTHRDTGLGLAIAKHLTEALDGQIGVRSTVGSGSTFWVVLSFKEQTAASLADGGGHADAGVDDGMAGDLMAVCPATAVSGHILVAEDNRLSRMVAVKTLEKLGHDVYAVETGRQVVDALATTHYDLVLCDVDMPEMDGFEATAIIRDPESEVLNHTIPVVAMTAHASPGDRERCLAVGMDNYLSKPVTRKDLARIVAQYLPAGEQAEPPPA